MTKARSLASNKAYNAWIPEIGDLLAITTKEATRAIKLDFGVPILLADNYLGFLIGPGLEAKGFFQWSREQKLLEMDDLPVTRLFTAKMHTRMRNDIQRHYGNMGLDLQYKGR